jgi:hypothetical protein
MKKIFLIMIIIFTSCTLNFSHKHRYDAKHLNNKYISYTELIKLKNFEKIFKKDYLYLDVYDSNYNVIGKEPNTVICMCYSNYLYCFPKNFEIFIERNEKQKLNDNFRYEYSLIIIDTVALTGNLIDSINVSNYPLFLESKTFLIMNCKVSGNLFEYTDFPIQLVSGIFLVNKKDPSSILFYEFKNAEPVIIKENNIGLHVIVNLKKLEIDYLSWFLRDYISNHWHKYIYTISDEYEEYLFSHDLKLVSRKKISKEIVMEEIGIQK